MKLTSRHFKHAGGLLSSIAVLLAGASFAEATVLVDVSFGHLEVGATPASVPNNGSLGGTFDLYQDAALAVPSIQTSGGLNGIGMNMDANRQNAYVGPVAPASVTGSGARTVEVWAFNPSLANEENIVSWGHRGTDNRNWATSFGNTVKLFGGVGQYGDDGDTPWTTLLPDGDGDAANGVPGNPNFQYLVYTFDGIPTGEFTEEDNLPITGTTRLYHNGTLNTEKGTPTDTFGGLDQFIIGSSNSGTEGLVSVVGYGTGGGAFRGLINSVRIHDVALDLAAIQAGFLAGPVPAPGGVGGDDPGDFDGNLTVNGNDLLQWQRDHSEGELGTWKTNFGTVYPAVQAIPEPCSGALILVAMTIGAARRRAVAAT
jgi:hypothetical protein